MLVRNEQEFVCLPLSRFALLGLSLPSLRIERNCDFHLQHECH